MTNCVAASRKRVVAGFCLFPKSIFPSGWHRRASRWKECRRVNVMTALCRADRLRIVEPSASAILRAERKAVLSCRCVIESMGNFSGLPAFSRIPMKSMVEGLDLGRGASEAAARWKTKNPGRVLVYGDYDVDGAASTAMAMEICRGRAGTVRFIPHATTRATASTDR